jgi:hypothetical protein
MYHSKNLNRINLDCFLKFVIHDLNSEMFEAGMMMLTQIEMTDMTDADVGMS